MLGAARPRRGVAPATSRAAADGTPIKDIVGDDPVEFADALVANYEKGGYVAREKRRLIDSIAQAEAQATGVPEQHYRCRWVSSRPARGGSRDAGRQYRAL